MSDEPEFDIESWWHDYEAALADEDPRTCDALLEDLRPHAQPGELAYARAARSWQETGPHAALPWLREAVDQAPDFADAHHGLAMAHEQLGDRAAMCRHFLEVLRLDAQHDEEDGIDDPELTDDIARYATEILRRLPPEFRDRLRDVPVVLEARPHADMVAEGFDPRSLGLFEGNPEVQQHESHDRPTRIVLFVANILGVCPDEDTLAEEIEITLLHEIGHFFGLDEEQVAELGLA